jgi:hypothetical protein
MLQEDWTCDNVDPTEGLLLPTVKKLDADSAGEGATPSAVVPGSLEGRVGRMGPVGQPF